MPKKYIECNHDCICAEDLGDKNTFIIFIVKNYFKYIYLIRRSNSASIFALNNKVNLRPVIESILKDKKKYALLDIIVWDKMQSIRDIGHEVLLFEWQNEHLKNKLQLSSYMQQISDTLKKIGKIELLRARKKWKI